MITPIEEQDYFIAVKEQESGDSYHRGITQLNRIKLDALAKAKQEYDEACHQAHAVARQFTANENSKFYPTLKNAREESFKMVAQAIGLDGIAADIHAYVCDSEHIHAAIRPLVTYHDLPQALLQATKVATDPDITQLFYDVPRNENDIDSIRLSDAVRSLDLQSASALFKHQCHYSAPPPVLEKNTLYIDIIENKVNCSVLSPYDDVITKTYDIHSVVGGKPLKGHIENHTIIEFIERNMTSFLFNLYYGNKAGCFNAFSFLMSSLDGFKSHVITTIAAYNKALARSHGFDSLILTKTHLTFACGNEYCAFDTTPLYRLTKEHTTVTSESNKRYYAACEEANDEYKRKCSMIEKQYIKAQAEITPDGLDKTSKKNKRSIFVPTPCSPIPEELHSEQDDSNQEDPELAELLSKIDLSFV